MNSDVSFSISPSRPSGNGATTLTIAVSDRLCISESITSHTFASYSDAITRYAV